MLRLIRDHDLVKYETNSLLRSLCILQHNPNSLEINWCKIHLLLIDEDRRLIETCFATI